MQKSSSTPLPLLDVHLPDAPSWLPLAWGWWAAIGSIVLIILAIVLRIRWKRKRHAPKKAALRLLDPKFGSQSPSSAMELLRQAALCYYPRSEIAHLTGKDWYAFLDEELGREVFIANEAQWQQALYKKQTSEHASALVEDCYQWVNEALPPAKRRKGNIGKH
ncbi:DUF4381 domain-containing protein [Vibrio zhugei]|uniref:DUF4381 domain-containing protein n=1 Tax=Vibrio zhugei TaxID=2479546 RepID=A0ABV7CCB3_9VIBR|nr:DUF4381 domain-containing protein [Vibrio zhugei]